MFLNVAVNAMEQWLEEHSDVHEQTIVEANEPIRDVISQGMDENDSWSFEPSIENKLKLYHDETAGDDLKPVVEAGYRVGLMAESHTAIAVPDFTYAPKRLTKNSRDTEDILTDEAQDRLRRENLWMVIILKSESTVNLQIRKQNGDVFEHYHKMTSVRDCLGYGYDFGFDRFFETEVEGWPAIIEDIKDRYETAVRTVVLDSPGTTRPDDCLYNLDELTDHTEEQYAHDSWDFD